MLKLTFAKGPLGSMPLLALLIPLLRQTHPAPLDPAREIPALLPARSLAVVDWSGLQPLLELGLDHPFVRNLLQTELAEALLAGAEKRPEDLLALGEHFLGRPVLPALAGLARHAALAVAVDPAGPRFVLVLQGDDATLLESTLSAAFERVDAALGLGGALDEPHQRVNGAEVWELGEELTLARREALFIASNDEGLLRDVLDLAADPEGEGLLARAEFRAHWERRDPEAALFGWIDLDALGRIDPENFAKLAEVPRRPEAQFLLGPRASALAAARSLSVSLAVEETGFELAARSAGAPHALLSQRNGFGAPVLPRAPDDVFAGVVERDFATLLGRRVELFAPEFQPTFAEALSNLALFFAGKDVAEEVLPLVSPRLALVSRPVAFEKGREPEIPLPAGALIVELSDPERAGGELISAFQSLIGLINVDRAQKARSGMQLRLALEGGIEISSARFPTPGAEDGVDLLYNLEPACAVVGRHLVLGTHVALVRSLVRELQAGIGAAAALGGDAEWLEASGAELARLVQANFEVLVQNKVLDEGVSLAQAEEELGGFRLLLASLARVCLALEHEDEGQILLRASFELAEAPETTR